MCVCARVRACVRAFYIKFNECDSGMTLTSVNTMQRKVDDDRCLI